MTHPRSRPQSKLHALSGTAVILLVALSMGGCMDLTSPNPIDAYPIDEVTFDPSLGIDLDDFDENPNGMWIRSDRLGTPPSAGSGATVEIDFTGWLPSGVKVAETEPGVPHSFFLGGTEMIPGVQVGVAGMSVGGQRTLLVPPYLGYGSSPPQGIPRNSWLVFEVVLVSVDGGDDDPI